MFCPNCGQEVTDGATFCKTCGSKLEAAVEQPPVYEEPIPQEPVYQEPVQQIPVQQEPVQQVPPYQAPVYQTPMYQAPAYQAPVQNQPPADYQYQKNAIRDSEMNALSVAWNYFAQLRGRYQEYDRVCKQVMYYARGAKNALLIWGSIALSIGLFFAFVFASSSDPDVHEGIIPFLCMFGIPGLLMIGGGILMKVNNRRKLAKYQKQYVAQAQELYSYYAAYPGCPVGLEYSNPDTIAYMMKLLQSGRAYTIRDSINLMVSERAGRINGHTAKLVQSTRAVNPQGNIPIFLPGALFRI